jgi:midasin
VQQTPQTFSQALTLALVTDTGVSVSQINDLLSSLKIDKTAMRRLEQMERTLMGKKSGGKARNGAVATIESLLQAMWQWTQALQAMPGEELQPARLMLSRLFACCWSFINAVANNRYDQALLAAWLSAVRTVLHSAGVDVAHPLRGLLPQIEQGLQGFGLVAQGTTGRALSQMWKALKPATTRNVAQLEALLEFERLVERFDAAAFLYRQSLDELASMRISFARALEAAGAGAADVNALSEKLRSLVMEETEEDGEKEDGPVTPRRPHFAAVFELYCQRLALTPAVGAEGETPGEMAAMELLAGRETKRGIAFASFENGHFSHLSSALPVPGRMEEDVSSHQHWPHTLLEQAKTAGEVSLGSLQLLESETSTLGRTVSCKAQLLCADELTALDAYLRLLMQVVCRSLADDKGDADIASLGSSLLRRLNRDGALDQSSQSVELQSKEDRISWIHQALERIVAYLHNGDFKGTEKLRHAADAWTSFACACLALYVPSQPCDPALKPLIEREFHRRTIGDLSGQLAALRSFRRAVTGEAETLRARILENDIQALGPEPDVEEVCRPETSELVQLQTEFDGLMRNLQPLFTNLANGEASAAGDCVVESNLERVRARLAQSYRAYADLTGPVVGFIDCLRTAQRLARHADCEQDSANTSPTAELVPFVRGTINSWLDDDKFINALNASRSQDETLFLLSVVATRDATRPLLDAAASLRDCVEQQFARLYAHWKTKLSEDQRKAAAKSSLYRYKGDEDLNEDSPEELNDLFPTYDEGQTGFSAANDVQSQAPKLAVLHHAIFRKADKPDSWKLLSEYGKLLPMLQGGREERESLPAIIIALDQLASAEQTDSSGVNYNIYTDANIPQVKRLASLLQKISTKFKALHQAWPEHATPVDVLRLITQVLEVSHSQPLTRFLPFVEKLHATMTEWQKVASREYSISELLDEVTSLIVGWRQLELFSWAGLLERETSNAIQDAGTWWFVAYETIIVASQSLSASPNELRQHAQALLATLEGFMMNCGLGEYAARLDLLRDFEAHLATSTTDTSAPDLVRQALGNFIAFYQHFEAPVAERLASGRAALEKDIKNVIQVASWKDRNVEMLNQSAKFSHKKLLRLVRKFRVLLAQPVAQILQGGVPKREFGQDGGSQDDLMAVSALSESDDGRALQLANMLPAWAARPDRFVNIQTTVNLMRTKAERVLRSFNAASRMSTFSNQLASDIAELRKATPSTLTDDNKQAVQHLKGQKRRLLADVLKDVRAMGFQTNPSDDILAKQASPSLVLASTPALVDFSGTLDTEASAYHFNRLLDIMPKVRESARKHSDDLTPAESARCVALLESMQQTSIHQRAILSQHMSHLNALWATLQTFEAFARCVEVEAAESGSNPGSLNIKTEVLRMVMVTCRRLVVAHSQLSGRDYSTQIQGLEKLEGQIAQLQQEGQSLPRLPVDLSCKSLTAAEARLGSVEEELRSFTSLVSNNHRELGALVTPITAWMGIGAGLIALEEKNGVSTMRADNWLMSTFKSLDQVLAAVQELSASSLAADKTKKGWIIQEFQELSRQLEILRPEATGESVLSLLGSLRSVNTSTDLPAVRAASGELLPIIAMYGATLKNLVKAVGTLHTQTNETAFQLASSFVQLAQQGFCSPPEKADGKDQQSGDVEAGTGLGDGEVDGAEDISKDIKDDEDLSELAQQPKADGTKEDIEDSKDAVDMADEDMEGEMGDRPDAESQDGDEKGDDGMEENGGMDEEAGEVDDLGPSTLDEKMWDEGKEEGLDEKEAEDTKGSDKQKDLAAGRNEASKDPGEGEGQDEQDQDELQAAPDEAENVERTEAEKMDPHAEEQDNLDLPEEIDIDGQKADDDNLSDLDDIPDQDAADEQIDGGQEVDEQEQDMVEADKAPEEGQGEQDEGEDEQASEDKAAGEDQKPGDEDEGSDILMRDEDVQQDVERADEPMFGESGAGGDDDESDPQQLPASAQDAQDAKGGAEAEQEPEAGACGAQQGKRTEETENKVEDASDDSERLPYKKIGGALDEWYRQNRHIESARKEDEPQPDRREDVDMADADFEHLPDDQAAADTQALGAASADQSTALDEDAGLPVNEDHKDVLPPMPEHNEEGVGTEKIENAANMEPSDSLRVEDKINALVGEAHDPDSDVEMDGDDDVEATDENQVDGVNDQLTNTHLDRSDGLDVMTIEEARSLWAEHESHTRNLALVLTEHLRLILQPTQATKMRGDFRTGKRLNIKRIIPYIASSYKRDKIWMRRSVPSKRSYQIMLAIDDSKSMAESDSRDLAFETLALVAKAMSMLEVGELSVVGFGEDITVAHEFNTPFTNEAGAEVFRNFTFSQTKTNVRKLLAESIRLFREARLKAAGSASDLWQLQLIISDGVCEDHPSIRQLVRQAHEERIMVVFIVVDAAAQQAQISGKPAQSILDLQTAEFVKDAAGEMQLKMVKYLDTFPFKYYLIVRDVQELPGVLAGALRQWFAEVVESGRH